MGRFKDDRAATDPVLIIAGIAITLILLVGGTFAVSGFINNAKDLNAKADLDRVATSQAAAMAASDAFLPSVAGPRVMTGKSNAALAASGIGFVPSEGNTVVVAVGHDGWAALAESGSGATFLRTSKSSATIKVDVKDIREDFLISALEGRLVDSGQSATSLDQKQVVRFPADVSTYNLAWTWVDAVWGLPEVSRPEPGAPRPGTTPTPGDGDGGTTTPEPTPTPTPTVPPFPAETPLADRLKSPFSSDTLTKVETSILTQSSSTNSCIYVSYWGQGTAWNIKLDPSHVLFNYDLDPSHYTVNAYTQIERVGDHLVISPKPSMLVYNNLEKGKKYEVQVCNRTVPLLVTSQVTSSAVTTNNSGKWEKTISASTPSEYYLSWKVRVDFTDVVDKFGMQPSAFRFMQPGTGAGKVTVTHVGGNIYEFVGIGNGVDLRKDKSIQFVVYPT